MLLVNNPSDPCRLWQTLVTDEVTYATGSVTRDDVNNLYGKSDNVIKVEHIVWLGNPPAETTRCGWVRFNTSPLPPNAVITRARFRYHVFYWEMLFNFQLRTLGLDPVTASARTLYDSLSTGRVCADVPMGRLWDTIELNDTAVAHINRSVRQGWVAFGLWGYGWSNVVTKRAWIIGWNSSPRSEAPELDVEYTVTGCGEQEQSRVSALDLKPVFAAHNNFRFDDDAPVFDVSGRRVGPNRLGQTGALNPGVYLVMPRRGHLQSKRRVILY